MMIEVEKKRSMLYVLGNGESRWIDKRILLRGEFFSNCFLFSRNDALIENMLYGVIDKIYFTEML